MTSDPLPRYSGSNTPVEYPVLDRFICKSCHAIHDADEPVDLATAPGNSVRLHCPDCQDVTVYRGYPTGDLEGRLIDDR